MWTRNLCVILAVLALGFLPAQLGAWLIEHEGWAGKMFGQHGSDLDAASSKFLIVGSAMWLFLLFDSIWIPWFNLKYIVFGIGVWEKVDSTIRAAAVLGYFISFYAVVTGFTQGLAI